MVAPVIRLVRARAAAVAVVVVSTVLLFTFGGAIVAAPVTLPLLYAVVRAHPGAGWRAAGALVGGLTAAEAGWAIAYVTAGEDGPLIWVLPMAAALAAAVVIAPPAGRRSRT